MSYWYIPPSLRGEDVCVYAEPLFALHAAAEVDLTLIEPTYEWLPTLPNRYLQRDVRLTTIGFARTLSSPTFVACALEKFILPGVIENGRSQPEGINAAVHVLVIEPVKYNAEFRHLSSTIES